LKGKNPKLITVHGDPMRDPRRHVVTILYAVTVDTDAVPKFVRCLFAFG